LITKSRDLRKKDCSGGGSAIFFKQNRAIDRSGRSEVVGARLIKKKRQIHNHMVV
jgi:hypothetical protein